jgi:hypothetical protein
VLPLRVLVAIASPSDKPPASIDDEVQVVEKAVQDLTGPGGQLEVDFLRGVTRAELAAQLTAKPYHVLHFIGHGGFDEVGDVEAPRAHLCFLRTDSDLSDPTDADTLSIILRNSSVRLVLLTACSSAAPGPAAPTVTIDPGPLGTGAFDGMAQRMVAGVSGVTAAVAMQFDLEEHAAVEFSKSFYSNLLRANVSVDEVVTLARRALVARLEAGHRAWVTPAVYWRCKGGNVFEIDRAVTKLDDRTLRELQDIDSQLVVYRDHVVKIAAHPAEPGSPIESLRLDWIAQIEGLLARRCELVGESVRVHGGRTVAGGEVECRMSVRLHQPGTVGLLQFRVEFPEDKLTYVRSEATAGMSAPPAAAILSGGALLVVLAAPGGGAPWPAGDHEIGVLRFSVMRDVPPSLIDIRVGGAELLKDNQRTVVAPIDGVVFIESAASSR